MTKVLFFVQYHSMGSSSRGIQSGGRIVDFDDLQDEEFMRSILKGRYSILYQVDRGYLSNLKSMQLSEFEAIFFLRGGFKSLNKINYLLGFSDIESPFRKEILEKYGALANKEKVSTTTKYNPGDIIVGVDDRKYLYLGNVARMTYIIDKEVMHNYYGHLYMPISYLDINKSDIQEFLKKAIINYKKFERFFLKTKRKAKKDRVIKYVNHNLALAYNDILDFTLPKNFLYSYNRALRIIYETKEN